MTKGSWGSAVSDEEQGDYEKQEPWYRWNVTFPVDRIQKKVDEQFPEVGKIKGLDLITIQLKMTQTLKFGKVKIKNFSP